MIPETRNIEVTSTLQGEKVAMGIQQNALAHIMSVLTDLYSDPELAVVREYSTNAFDAHVEAGVSLPVEVTTPTSMSPYFKVRDFGNGLNAEDIRNIYSQYGASTKRDSDDVVGMLGLGCKSALTYTDQFTLTGIKDGIATQVAISRDEDGAGSMTIVASYATDEASGVEVVVPAKGDNTFADTAADFFRFWESGTVLVNGKEPVEIEGLQVTDDILVSNNIESSYIVMGNVAYPFTTYERYNIVARVPIGAVQFTPSREALQMTDKTVQVIADVKLRAEEAKLVAVQALVDAAQDRFEGIALALEAESVYGIRIKTLSYKGVEFPDRIEIKDAKGVQEYVAVRSVKPYRSKGWSREKWVSTSMLSKVVFMTGYNGSNFTPTKRTKLEMWMDSQAVTAVDGTVTKYAKPELFFLIDKLTKAEKQWIRPEQIVNWADVDAIKVPRTGRSGVTKEDGAPSGSYEGFADGARRSDILATEINPSNRKGLFYCDHKQSYKYSQVILSKYPNATIIELPANRKGKFLRFFPKARPCNEIAKKIASDWAAKLSREEVLAINFQQAGRYEYNYMSKLDASLIQDEEFAAVVTAYKTRAKASSKYEIMSKFLYGTTFANMLDDIIGNYKLLTAMNVYGTISEDVASQIIIYLNAAYMVGKEQ